MILDRTDGALDAVKALAKQAGPQAEANLASILEYLDTYAQGRTVCEVYRDPWAPHSFGLRMRAKDNHADVWWVGGLIYSGPGLGGSEQQQSDGSGPSFSVDLCPAPAGEHHWRVHT